MMNWDFSILRMLLKYLTIPFFLSNTLKKTLYPKQIKFWVVSKCKCNPKKSQPFIYSLFVNIPLGIPEGIHF